jgi:hypothetical protein
VEVTELHRVTRTVVSPAHWQAVTAREHCLSSFGHDGQMWSSSGDFAEASYPLKTKVTLHCKLRAFDAARLLFQPLGGGFYDYDSTCCFMHVWPANCRQLRTPSKVALLHSMSLRSERRGAKAAPKWMVSLDHGYEWVSPTSELAY